MTSWSGSRLCVHFHPVLLTITTVSLYFASGGVGPVRDVLRPQRTRQCVDTNGAPVDTLASAREPGTSTAKLASYKRFHLLFPPTQTYYFCLNIPCTLTSHNAHRHLAPKPAVSISARWIVRPGPSSHRSPRRAKSTYNPPPEGYAPCLPAFRPTHRP